MQINNIIKISYVSCQLISGFLRLSETEAKISDDIPFCELLNFKKPAALTISDKVEDGNRVYQSKLVFLYCDHWLKNAMRLAFLCETADGVRYLIGTDERPFPIITQQENHPNNYSDNQLTEVTVSYSSGNFPPIIK